MASLHQIQRTMTKQQQEIDALIAQQRQDRARLLEQNRKELEAIRKQYEQALKKHDQQTDAAYRKALDDMQFRLTDVYRQKRSGSLTRRHGGSGKSSCRNWNVRSKCCIRKSRRSSSAHSGGRKTAGRKRRECFRMRR